MIRHIQYLCLLSFGCGLLGCSLYSMLVMYIPNIEALLTSLPLSGGFVLPRFLTIPVKILDESLDLNM